MRSQDEATLAVGATTREAEAAATTMSVDGLEQIQKSRAIAVAVAS